MVKGAAVYAPLERDDMIYRVPKIHPAISIKLGPVVNGQVKGLIIGQKLQQKPDLFLPDANWPLVAPLKTPGQTIAQPAGRLAKNPDMPGHQSGFFGQLAIHGLNRRFVLVHDALGKLPAATSGPTRPEHAAIAAGQHNPDVGPESIRINHDAQCCGRLSYRPANPVYWPRC